MAAFFWFSRIPSFNFSPIGELNFFIAETLIALFDSSELVNPLCIEFPILAARILSRVVSLIKKYGLPVYCAFDAEIVLAVMQADKKKVKDVINYVLLEKIGKAVVEPMTIFEIDTILRELENNDTGKYES